MTTLDKQKIARYDQTRRNEILNTKNEDVARAEAKAAVALWCMDNNIDSELVGFTYKGSTEFTDRTYGAGGGRLSDADIAALKRKLKKAPFKFSISGVTS